MNLYRTEDGQWVGTQADGKATGQPFVPVDVPVDKAGLLGFLNEMELELRNKPPVLVTPNLCHEEIIVPERFNEVVVSYVEPETPPLMEVVSAPPTAVDVYKPHKLDSSNDVVEDILGSSGDLFGIYLNATIDRLGELRNEGFDALAVLRKQVKSFPNRAATERGLGYFLLGDVG